MQVTFRRATEADWPRIWPIFAEVVQAADTYAHDPATDSATGRAIWLVPPPDETWLALDADGTVLGSYKTGANRAGPGAHIGTASYMVDRGRRGSGVGRAMVLHSLDRARALGFRGVQFNAVTASNVHAVRLYSQLGFEIVGRVPGGFRHPEQGYVDLLVMFCDLTR
ncbi:MAG TPA: GNAT family N-acetyltransferase [Jatrophihabitans sp.]|nr:GNAT family N-acetyltransferase [Jatrophihabitans sp.]